MGNLIYQRPGGITHRKKALNIGTSLIFTADLEAFLPLLPPEMGEAVKNLPQMRWVEETPYTSQLRAIDPLSGKTIWAVDKLGWQDRCGVLATKSGILFHGSVSGHFYARDADNGEILKSIDTGSSILAAPMTYKIGKDQYVAVAAGWGGGGWPYVPDYSAAYSHENTSRILVFKLDGGTVKKPKRRPALEVAPEAPAQAAGVTPETIAKGAGIFFANCAMCHANKPRSISPDLRRMQPVVHELFNKIVLEGLFLPKGMPRWDDLLSEDDAQALHAYLIDLQTKLHAKEKALKAAGKPLDSRAATILSNY
jgi:quinohemoprotein ethanol dehydrogenase